MKKRTLLFVIMVILSSMFHASNLFAQGDSPESCEFQICKTDNTCTDNGGNCASLTGCNSTNFTVLCTGQYCLNVYVACTTGSCNNCRGCVNVYNGVNFIAICENASCNSNCNFSCCDGGGFTLSAGVTYTLYVCKVPCPDHTCNDCPSTCTVTGCIKYLGP